MDNENYNDINCNANKYKKLYIKKKQARREQKRTLKRDVTADEVLFIFEKVLEGWTTIRIYNKIIQNNPSSNISKKKTEVISTGNCKIYENELNKERYEYYLDLRKKVCEFYSSHI